MLLPGTYKRAKVLCLFSYEFIISTVEAGEYQKFKTDLQNKKATGIIGQCISRAVYAVCWLSINFRYIMFIFCGAKRRRAAVANKEA